MNYASPYDAGKLKETIQRVSTEVHSMVRKLQALWVVMIQIADDDLKAIIAAGEGLVIGQDDTAINALFSQVRDWQYAMKNYADNYANAGSISDNSYHIAKRAII